MAVDPESFEFDFLMPSKRMILEIDRDAEPLVFLLTDHGASVEVQWLAYGDAEVRADCVALCERRSDRARLSLGCLHADAECTSDAGPDFVSRFMRSVAPKIDIALAMLAEPRLIEAQPPSRAERRRAQRVMGDAAPGPAMWWRTDIVPIDRYRRNRKQEGGTGTMPLHFCRAHWRILPEGQIGDEWLPDIGRWRKWISHSLKGHPANGIRLPQRGFCLDNRGRSDAVIRRLEERMVSQPREEMLRQWEARKAAGKNRKGKCR